MSKTMKRGVTAAIVAVVLAAVFVIIKPSAAQAAYDYVTSGEIKDQTVQSRDLGPDSVGTSELKDGSTFFKNLSQGTQDLINSKASKGQAQGYADQAETDAKGHANQVAQDAENAAKGYADANDDKGINESRAGAGYTNSADPGYSVKFAKCPAGKVAISGGYRLNGHASEAFSGADQNAMPEGLTVVATEPAGVVNGELVNTYKHPDFPQTEGGSFQGNAWAVTFKNDTENPLPVRVWATCVNAS